MMNKFVKEYNMLIAKRLTAILVAVVFVLGMMYMPAEIFAAETDTTETVETESEQVVPEDSNTVTTPNVDSSNEGLQEAEEVDNEDPTSESENVIADESPLPNEETKVTVVNSIEELAKESKTADNEAFFTIDVGNKETADSINVNEVAADVEDIISNGGSTNTKKQNVVDALEDSGFYTVDAESGKKIEVTSTFAAQRLCLIADQEESIAAYGAEKAVFYDDSYLLTYESEEAAKQAFDALEEEYGSDSVIIDIPVKATSSDIYGWGTSYMGMTTEKTKLEGNGRSVKVAVVDTGINSSHALFNGKGIENAYNSITGEKAANDDNGHGTAVSGIVAESTPSNVTIMPVKALDSDANGYLMDVLNGARYASENGADIINLSLGGKTTRSNLAKSESWFSSHCSNSLIVCASGNESCNMDGSDVYYFPGEVESTVCVGAYNRSGNICSWSNYGNAVDFAAPGSDICVADYADNNAYTVMSGTSFASPYVAAAAALKKAEGETNLRGTLEGIAVDMGSQGDDVKFGKGCPEFKENIGNDRNLISPSGSINRKNIVITNVRDAVYTGSAITQSPTIVLNGYTLRKGKDYTLSYSNNICTGTATMTVTGAGNYTDCIDRPFAISRGPIDSAVRLSQTSYTYDGGMKTPTIIARNKGTVLEEGTDYSVSYSAGRTAPGNYTVSVTGLGNYAGKVNLRFTINKPADIVDLPAVKIQKPSAGKKKLTAKWKKVSKSNQKKIAGIEIEVVGNGIDVIYTAGKSKKSKTIKSLKSKKYYKVRVRTYRYDGYYKHVSKWSGFKKKKIK